MTVSLAHTGRRRFTRALLAVSAGVLSLGVVSACGSGGGDAFSAASPSAGTSTTAGSGGAGTKLVVGGANFTEAQLLTQVYVQALTKAGYSASAQNVDTREIYLKALQGGQVDVVPDYAATLTSYLADQQKATVTPSADITATVAALTPLAQKAGLTVLKASPATDQNTFVVSQDFATKNNLKTLSDLAALRQPVKLAAGKECPERPFCEPGLEKTYGMQVTTDPVGSGTAASFQAVKNGTDQLALAFTSDGTYKSFDLVELTDDKKLQASDNIIGVLNTAKTSSDPKIGQTIDAVNAALTTADLQDLNGQIGTQRKKPEDVARTWLASKGLA